MRSTARCVLCHPESPYDSGDLCSSCLSKPENRAWCNADRQVVVGIPLGHEPLDSVWEMAGEPPIDERTVIVVRQVLVSLSQKRVVSIRRISRETGISHQKVRDIISDTFGEPRFGNVGSHAALKLLMLLGDAEISEESLEELRTRYGIVPRRRKPARSRTNT